MTLSDEYMVELLKKARGGDVAALDSLIAGMRGRIVRWALVVTRDRDDAEDVAQQVSIALHRKLAEFESRASFTTWLYTVARNAAIELTRKAHRKRELRLADEMLDAALPAHTEDALDRMSNQRAAALIRSFFTELPARQRELIELVDHEGCSAAEAAARMGIEPDTARVHLMRARRTLRSRMLDQYPETFE